MKRRQLLPLIAIISIAMFYAACQPDPDNGNGKNPTNIKTYTGTTDQNENVKFQTGEISSELWLLEYQLTVIYEEGGETDDFYFSEYKSDGIQKISNNSFKISLDPKDYIDGTVNSAQTEISGTYSYEFITAAGDTVVSGSFSATASK